MMLPPLNLHGKCDVSGTYFYVSHSLSFIKGGIFIARHNEVRDELLYLSRLALP